MSQRKPTPRRTAGTRATHAGAPVRGGGRTSRSNARASLGVSASRAQKSTRSAHGRAQAGGFGRRANQASMPALAKGASSAAFRASHAATARAAAAQARPTARRVAGPLDRQVNIPFVENERGITRRQLLIGAVGLGALIAAGAGMEAVSASKEAENAVETLEVAPDAVSSLGSGAFAAIEGDAPLATAGEYRLPYGTLVWANSDTYAACLLPTEGAAPITQAGVLSLSDGTLQVVLDKPVSPERGFDIYDVRCNEHGMIWVEANCLSGEWRVYQAPLAKGALGQASLADSGDANYDAPFIAAAANRAFWQTAPSPHGTALQDDSLLKSVAFGGSDVREDCRSKGRMATPVYSTGEAVVISPRVDAAGVYHRITLIDAESGSPQDSMTLPVGMKPLEAGYVDRRFTFSFDAGYQDRGGLSSIGTYAPIDRGGASGGSWFCFDRNPTAAPAWIGPYMLVKSTRTVSGVNFADNTYFSLPCPDACDAYGDYLASTGTRSAAVTFTGMPSADASEAHTLVRVWKA